MYSINCDYYHQKFESIGLLIEHITTSGMDPNYEITKDGVGIGEDAIDFIIP